MSINIKNISPYHQKETLAALKTFAKKLEGKDAVLTFIDSLLTKSEQVTIGRRVLMATMILEGHSRAEIRHKLGMSPNTFSRTRKWLERELPNYNDALEQFNKAQSAKKLKLASNRIESTRPFSLEYLKKRYPMHFLLLNVIDELRK